MGRGAAESRIGRRSRSFSKDVGGEREGWRKVRSEEGSPRDRGSDTRKRPWFFIDRDVELSANLKSLPWYGGNVRAPQGRTADGQLKGGVTALCPVSAYKVNASKPNVSTLVNGGWYS